MNKRKIFLLILLIIGLSLIMNISSVNAVDKTINSTTSGGLKTAIDGVGIGDTVYMESGVYSGQNNTNISINKDVKIIGKTKSVTINANSRNIIFNIGNNVNVTIINITFINGMGGSLANNGLSGGIENGGNLQINNCTFSNCKSSSDRTGKGFEGYAGGAIHNSYTGNMVIINSVFTNNTSLYGGAICNIGKLSITDSNFTNNTASQLGEGNVAYFYGGGVYSIGHLNVNNCSFNNNYACYGGGIFSAYGECIVLKSNFAINIVAFNKNEDSNGNANGGGIYNYNSALSVENSIFGQNYVYGSSSSKATDIMSNIDFTLKNTKFTSSKYSYYLPNTTVNEISPVENETNSSTNNTNGNSSNPNENNQNPINNNQNNPQSSKLDTQISITGMTGSYGQTITLTIRLTSADKVLVGKQIMVYINNKQVETKITNNNGIITINYKIPSVDKYIIKAVFNGDIQYKKLETSSQFSSSKAKVTMTLNKKLYNNKIYVKLTALGKPLKNKIVKFYVKRKYVGKGKTNSKGIVLFKYTKNRGKLNVKTLFSEDNLFSSVFKTNKIKL